MSFIPLAEVPDINDRQGYRLGISHVGIRKWASDTDSPTTAFLKRNGSGVSEQEISLEPLAPLQMSLPTLAILTFPLLSIQAQNPSTSTTTPKLLIGKEVSDLCALGYEDRKHCFVSIKSSGL